MMLTAVTGMATAAAMSRTASACMIAVRAPEPIRTRATMTAMVAPLPPLPVVCQVPLTGASPVRGHLAADPVHSPRPEPLPPLQAVAQRALRRPAGVLAAQVAFPAA
jgi:hypothetical protein